jgi:hypothetical protein
MSPRTLLLQWLTFFPWTMWTAASYSYLPLYRKQGKFLIILIHYFTVEFFECPKFGGVSYQKK